MLGDLLQEFVGQAIFEFTFYCVGWIAIRCGSLGRWHCLPVLSEVPKQETRWGGLLHRRTDGVYFTSGGTAAVGGLLCLVTALLVLLPWFFWHH